MPWSSLENVPANLKKLDGVPLTLAQANSIAKVADSVEDVDNPWAVAKAQFKKTHKKNDDNTGWVKKESESASQVFFAQRLIKLSKGSGDPYLINIEAAREGSMRFIGSDGEEYNFAISEEDIDFMILNFNKGVVGFDVNVDIEHFSEKPHKAPSPAFTESLGRVVKLWKGETDNPNIEGNKTLCATLELNKEGKRLIEEGKYRYSSVVIWRKWIDATTGKKAKGAVLSSIAFTNTPVGTHLKSLGEFIPEEEGITESAIAASRWIAIEGGVIFLSREEKETPNRQGGTMPKTKAKPSRELFSTVEGTSTTVLEDMLKTALSEVEALGEDGFIGWPFDILFDTEDPTKGNVIYSIGGEEIKYNRPYTISEDGASVKLGERIKVEVKTEYVEDGTEPVIETPTTETPTAPAEVVVKIETPPAAPIPEVTVETASKRKGSAMTKTEIELKETKAKLARLSALKALEHIRTMFSKQMTKLRAARSKDKGKALPPAILEKFGKIQGGFESFVASQLGLGEEKAVKVSFSKFREMYQAETAEAEEIVEEVIEPVEEAVEESGDEEAKEKVDTLRQVLELATSLTTLLQSLLEVDLAPAETVETETPSVTPEAEVANAASKDSWIANEARRIVKEEGDNLAFPNGKKPKREADKYKIAVEMATKTYHSKHGGEA